MQRMKRVDGQLRKAEETWLFREVEQDTGTEADGDESASVESLFDVDAIPEAPKLNEAHRRHAENSPGAAVIESACGAGENACQYKDACRLQASLDDFLFDGLNVGLVLAVEVRYCKKYRPKNEWSAHGGRIQSDLGNEKE